MRFVLVFLFFFACGGHHSAYAQSNERHKRLLAPPKPTQSAYHPPDSNIIAQSCLTCHRHEDGAIPALTGWEAEDLAQRLIALRDGEDGITIMQRLLVPFSDADIDALARTITTDDKFMSAP